LFQILLFSAESKRLHCSRTWALDFCMRPSAEAVSKRGGPFSSACPSIYLYINYQLSPQPTYNRRLLGRIAVFGHGNFHKYYHLSDLRLCSGVFYPQRLCVSPSIDDCLELHQRLTLSFDQVKFHS